MKKTINRPLTEEEVETPVNPPQAFLVTPTRIGRIREPEQFEIRLHEHRRRTAEVLSEKIFKYVEPFLLSKEIYVTVDLRRGQFQINHGRFGGGYIERIEEGADNAA